MSEYQDFILEKEKIDSLIEQGFQIARINENLYGAYVDFERTNQHNEKEKRQLHIKMAEARKYFSTLLIMNQVKV